MATMQTYDAFEKQNQRLLDQMEKFKLECVSCPKCGAQWFTEIKVSRYQVNHNVVLGQAVPTEPDTIPYILLKCVKCEDLLEPRILHNTRDVAGGGRYDHFLDTLEGKYDDREVEEKEKEKDAVPSQEL